ncbi:MAG: hypothetical protein FJ115_00085 [Deltaproteobacteria bacterium]|nr:hypothetical protein [Deltaproteobacteria bacterium]MBM4321927.1 hypothetical protein [Deltaproteobacteria bacterium]
MRAKSQILIIERHPLLSAVFISVFVDYFQRSKDEIELLSDNLARNPEQLHSFLKKNAHKYNILINANFSYQHEGASVSYDGLELLLPIYENIREHIEKEQTRRKISIISFQSLEQLRNRSEKYRILLEPDSYYDFYQLPISLSDLAKIFKLKRGGNHGKKK